MCGRYTLIPNENFYERFEIDNRLDNLEASYNIAPGQFQPVIISNSPNQIQLMRWGLIPSWAKDPKIAYHTINAKAETVATKPAFRNSFKSKRCLVPASGFYEWKNLDSKRKQPFYFQLKSQELFAFAGLFDIWQNEKGEELKTYTIITTQANTLVNQIHERMPVIIPKETEAVWLDKTTDIQTLQQLLQTFTASEMLSYPVSSLVNDVSIDDPNLIKPL